MMISFTLFTAMCQMKDSADTRGEDFNSYKTSSGENQMVIFSSVIELVRKIKQYFDKISGQFKYVTPYNVIGAK